MTEQLRKIENSDQGWGDKAPALEALSGAGSDQAGGFEKTRGEKMSGTPTRKRHFKVSLVVAIVLAIAAGVWIASGNLPGSDVEPSLADAGASAPAAGVPVAAEKPQQIQSVRVYESVAQNRRSTQRIAGRTEASRSGRLMAEIQGTIRKISIEEGDTVSAQQEVGRIDVQERAAVVREAEALLQQREIEYSAAAKLAKKGFQSEVSKAQALAELEAAKAVLDRARLDLSKTRLAVPFDGVVWTKNVEEGDLVQVGDLIASIVDLDPLLVVANVSEREISSITEGGLAQAKLITGETVEGIVSYISPQADTSTRTFRVEIEVPDTGNRFKAGITAELFLPTADERAHLISPALLTLNDDGQVGVMSVESGNIARFLPVSIDEDSINGVWISGLPDRVTVVSVGQEYLSDGQQVEAVQDTVFKPQSASGS